MKETAKRIIALLLVLAMSVSACPMEALAAETSELAVSSAETSAEAEPTEEAEASTEAPAEEDAFTETPAEEEAPADESTEKDASTETSAEKSTEEISSAEHKSTETFSEEVAEGEASAQCDTAQEETDISDCEQQYYDLINGIDLTEEDAEDQFLALKEEIDALKAEASEYLAVPSEESELLTASDTSDSSLITGNCGDNITWTMNEAQTTLYIEGTGDFVAPRKNIWGQSLYYWTGSSTLETVVIGEGITDIGEFNFAQCSKLSSVSIPNTVTTIRIDAFCGTKSLKKLEIPDSVTSVRKAFCGCTGLTDISLPDTITSVRAAFQNCYSLTNIDFLPDSVTDISGAFINCTSLESVQFPAGVTSIANNTTDYDDIVEDVYANNIKKGGAFQGCTALKTIDFGDNITEIGYKAFYDCDSLSTVRLSDSITTIGNLAFGSCAKLGVIVIPDSVTSMGKYVFQDCPQLNTAGPIYSGGVYEISYDIQFGWKTEIPSYAFSNSGIYKIELPDTITKIDSYAFSGCSKLKRMYLPDSLISAGDDAFSGTAITGIRVPGTVTSIDFDSCKKLTDIIFEEKDSTNEEWSLSLSFNYVTATAYYPAGDAAWKNVVNRDYGENADITWKPLTKTEATDTLNEKDSILNGSGTAAARFYLCDEDGMSLPLEIFSYTYTLDGTTYEVTNCQTNIYGGYDFEAPTTLTYDSDADNAEDYVFTVTLENSETKLLHDTYTIHAQVTPLVYKEKWTFALGISGGAGAGELSHTSAAIIVLNHKSDGTQDLTLSLKLTDADVLTLQEKADLGEGIKVSAFIENGSGSQTAYQTYSTTITNYTTDTTTTEGKLNQELLAGYLNVILLLGLQGNVTIQKALDKIGMSDCMSNFDVTDAGFNVTIKGSGTVLKFGKITINDGSIDTQLVGDYSLASGSSSTSYGWSATSSSNGTTYTTSIGAQESFAVVKGGILDLIGIKGLWASEKASSASITSGVDSMIYKLGFSDNSAVVLDTSLTEYRAYTLDRETRNALLSSNSELNLYYGGQPVSIDYLSNMTEILAESGLSIPYEDSQSETTSISWSPSISLSMQEEGKKKTLGSLGISLSADRSTEAQTGTGIFENEESYSTGDSITSLTVATNQEHWTEVNTIFAAAISGFASIVSDMITNVSKSVTVGVSNGAAKIEAVVDVGVDWVVSIFAFEDDDAEATSYSVASYAASEEELGALDEDDLTESSTVGNPYMIGVDDADGNEITDLSEQPLTLSISYTQEELDAANVASDDEENLAIYVYDSENDAYRYVGSTVDTENKIVTVEISETGEYVLLADGAAPDVTNIAVSDASSTPTITAIIKDTSGISGISMSIDGTETVSSDDFSDYYTTKTGVFSYTVSEALELGDHTVSFTATDKKGLVSSEVSFQFTVQSAPIISDVSVPAYCYDKGWVTLSAKVAVAEGTTDNAIKNVWAEVTSVPRDGYDLSENTETYYLTETDGVYTVKFKAGRHISKYVIKIAALDELGSRIESEEYTCTFPTGVVSYETDEGTYKVNLRLKKITGYSGSSESITIPDNIYGCDITAIESSAFKSCTSLTSVTISEGITSIGSYAFRNCTNLATVEVQGNLDFVGKDAFDGTAWLTAQSGFAIVGTVLVDYQGTDTEVVIPDGVTAIGNCAFYYCTGLTSVTIPDGVTSIGDYAFYCCSSLTGVTIPGSVVSIGDYAFSYCTGLTDMAIPDGVTSVGKYAFHECSSLANVTIANSVTSIGKYAFSDCYALTAITLGSGVAAIGDYAFEYCTKLASITIPGSVTSIGYRVFGDCSSLAEINVEEGNTVYSSESGVLFNKKKSRLIQCPRGRSGEYTIPDSVTILGNYAFAGCTSLTGITIPDSVTSIGASAFAYCDSITAVVIPDSVRSIGQSAFSYCNNLTECTIGENVVSIGYKAFYSCTSLTSIVIPDSVTSIGDYAFRDCSKVTSIVIGDGVKEIGSDEFENCGDMPSISIGSGVKEISEYTFSFLKVSSITVSEGNTAYSANEDLLFDKAQTTLIRCAQGKIGDCVIPDSVTSIGYEAFCNCTSITGVQIPSGVSAIGNYTFGYCTSLASVTIGSGVTSISNFAFSGCSSLVSVEVSAGNSSYSSSGGVLFDKDQTTLILYPQSKSGNYMIPDSVTTIGSKAFYGCNNLTSVIIPDSVASIGNYAFYGCSSLTGISLGSGVTSIGNYAFYDCSGLASVAIPDSITTIGKSAFYGCSGLLSVTIPGSITSIDSSVFYRCSSLTSVSIGSGVTSIGSSAFYGCSSLSVVIIPDSVTSIGYRAFYSCKKLSNTYYPGSETQWGEISISSGNTWLTDSTIHYNYAIPSTEARNPDMSFASVGVTKTYGDAAFTNELTCDSDGAVTYSSSNEEVATVDENGEVTIVGAGETTITAESEETDTYEAGSASYTLTVTLTAPVLSSVANSTTGVTVKWGAVTGAVKYRVYYKGGTVTKWTKAGDTTGINYTVTGLASGTKYTFTVRCVSSDGKSFTSGYDTTGKSILYLSAGTISSLTNTSKGVTVKWSKITGASGYYVYRKTGSGSYSKIATIKSDSTVSYSDTSVKSKNGTTYSYAVRPYSGKTLGAYTGVSTVRLSGTSVSSASNKKGKKLYVKWKKDSKATGYQIQYSTSSSFSGAKTVTVSKNSTVSTTISSLTKGKKYYIRVRTYKTVSGTKYYSAWAKYSKSVKISK